MSKISAMTPRGQAPIGAGIIPYVENNINYSLSITNLLSSVGGGVEIATFADVKAATSGGGTFTQDVYQTRDITTLDAVSWASLATNQLTLAIGDYVLLAFLPACLVGKHSGRAHNVTASLNYDGVSAIAPTSPPIQSCSVVFCSFSLAVQSIFEMQHKCETTVGTYGFGTDGLADVASVFTIGGIIKL